MDDLLFVRPLGHRFGAGAAPFGSAFRTRVPRPSGFGLLPLAGSGFLSQNFLSCQRGDPATWERRTFAPFGMCVRSDRALRSYETAEMTAHEIGPRVGNVRHDDVRRIPNKAVAAE